MLEHTSGFGRRLSACSPSLWRRVGPIALGVRASTAEVGDGYVIQSYYCGALVLHMLRRLLAAKNGGDELFDSVLARTGKR